jgi:hypothetical protein
MAERVARLRFRCITEQAADVRIAFNIRAPCEIEIAPVRLGFAGESVLQVFMALGTFETLAHRFLLL